MFMYPQSNSARSVRDLSGVWDFRSTPMSRGSPLRCLPPTTTRAPTPEFRRHYGMAYYRTTFTVPEARAGCCASTL